MEYTRSCYSTWQHQRKVKVKSNVHRIPNVTRGHCLLATAFWPRPFGDSLLTKAFWLQPFGHNLLATSFWPQVFGHKRVALQFKPERARVWVALIWAHHLRKGTTLDFESSRSELGTFEISRSKFRDLEIRQCPNSGTQSWTFRLRKFPTCKFANLKFGTSIDAVLKL